MSSERITYSYNLALGRVPRDPTKCVTESKRLRSRPDSRDSRARCSGDHEVRLLGSEERHFFFLFFPGGPAPTSLGRGLTSPPGSEIKTDPHPRRGAGPRTRAGCPPASSGRPHKERVGFEARRGGRSSVTESENGGAS